MGFAEFVRELCAGDVADSAAVLGGGEAGADEEVGFAGAGVSEEDDWFGSVDECPGLEGCDDLRADHWVRVEVEVVEGLDAWEAGFLNASGAAAFVAHVEFDTERFVEERRVG